MKNETQILNLLGLARKANRVSFGHDAAKAALRGGKARLCLLCTDASPRLAEEMTFLAAQANIALQSTGFTAQDIKTATQYKAAVLTINERGFAQKIKALTEQ
ncbi:MAG: ribosomal L7Ae/L30e/S12e/Gadd45 family protein [Oscillospiraceae bacterium]|jgi:ribosomal protein L7Ae-like RNA K-turn-binding protein|nr:ribosomal L7Ae/L30e/S12e/Gadd45 family protein [Oscillospiraceae bacterium]